MNISKKSYIIISPPTKASIHKILKSSDNNQIKWIYLGENVISAIDIEKMIGEKGERINIADRLQKTARLLRNSYINYIGKLNVGLQNWWATTLSEKNPFISTTFLYICYLKVCGELLKNNKSTHLVIFAENHALRKTIFKNYSNIYKIEYVDDRLGDFSEYIHHNIKNMAQKAHYVFTNILYILIVKYYYKQNVSLYKCLKNNYLFLLRDWIDYRSFDADGRYNSAYLGKLNAELETKGKSILIIPYICNINKKIIHQLINSNEPFVIPHSFLTARDIISKLFIKHPVLKSYPVFDELDITWIIHEDFKKDNARFIDALLNLDIIKNLKNSNIYFKSCIYLYENYIDEKIFCMGMRTFYPSTRLTGYQHSTAPTMLLSYFFSNTESKTMPLPDKIVTNGPYFTKLFIEEGYPIEKVVTGGAIRYGYLYDKHDFRYRVNHKKLKYNILVTSSISANETLELIAKVIKVFGEKEKFEVTIKYHPAINLNIIKKYIQTFPSNVHISEKPIPELLKNTDLVVYTFTGACVEALYVGVPILHVKSDYIIDLDLFDYEQADIYSAKNVTEIIQMSNELLQLEEAQLKSKQAIWKNIVKDMFGTVNDSTYKLLGSIDG